MSKFASDKTKKIEFDDDEYAEIRASISWQELKNLTKAVKESDEGEINNMFFFLKSWNFKDDNGKVVELNKENIKRLTVGVFNKIDKEMAEILLPRDKKKPKKE